MSVSKPNVFNIPAGTGFSHALARGLLEQANYDPAKLSTFTVLLPTRRACRVLRDSFLSISEGKPLILPKLQTIGDIDDHELLLDLFNTDNLKEIINLPPTIHPLHRQALLTQAILATKEFSKTTDQAFLLAQTLAQLMDQIYTEDLDIKDISKIVPESFAFHWQITLDFLNILIEEWPKIISSQGLIESANKRNILIKTLSSHWEKKPPKNKIIAAGSTGSIPATANLLKTIANSKNGTVVLPGLDTNLDEISWDHLDDTHPQATLKSLLKKLAIDRNEVKQWPQEFKKPCPIKSILASEIMRPVKTAHLWSSLLEEYSTADIKNLKSKIKNIKRFNCETTEQEAKLISIILRETLELPDKTASVITPDKNLARRIRSECKRWNIDIDDSAGEPLLNTQIGILIMLSLKLCQTNLAPSKFAALLKHPFCNIGLDTKIKEELAKSFEINFLRGGRPPSNFDALRSFIINKNENASELILLDQLEPILTPLLNLSEPGKKADFGTFVDIHIELVESLYKKEIQQENDTVWTEESGVAAANFFSDIKEASRILPKVNCDEYETILKNLLSKIVVRPAYGMNPRVFILGQLEARLVQTDIILMAGLNEGTWPSENAHDPWMSRPMRKEFGLPSLEKTIGLSAHDFIQGFCSQNVIITRSNKDEGTPTVPSRWLQRLDTVLQALEINPDTLSDPYYLFLLKKIDEQNDTKPATRPAPCPPLSARPRSLSVTQIEKWVRDPYSLYANKILSLRKLKPLEERTDAAIKGTIVHDALDKFISKFPNELPDNSEKLIQIEAEQIIQDNSINISSLDFWWPRFERISKWFVKHEKNWRTNASPLKTEINGSSNLKLSSGKTFEIKAKADRIDRLNDNTLAIIDYKTGTLPSNIDIKMGLSPQLPLEALIAVDPEKGFTGVKTNQVGYIGFWKLSGGTKSGEENSVSYKDLSIDELIIDTKAGLSALVEAFDNENTPYYSLPRVDYAPPIAHQDYAHLARVQEWCDIDDSEGGS
jgi:ATP-dependent helicase/nuclease subunit B